jgi:outer membrane protein
MAALKVQLAYAHDNFTAVSRQFQLGLASSLDVLDANTELLSTEQKLAWSTLVNEVAVLKVKKASGTFLKEVMANLQSLPVLKNEE